MANNGNGNQFREDEIITLEQLRDGKMVRNIFPKIGGRLRLAHEENDQLSITTEIIKYDENLAVVRAITTTMKGSFPGIGMASVERDHSIAPAILELAETRAIARSLRFAGYGVEYCSAEEISHLENGNSKPPATTGGKEESPNNARTPTRTTVVPMIGRPLTSSVSRSASLDERPARRASRQQVRKCTVSSWVMPSARAPTITVIEFNGTCA